MYIFLNANENFIFTTSEQKFSIFTQKFTHFIQEQAEKVENFKIQIYFNRS